MLISDDRRDHSIASKTKPNNPAKILDSFKDNNGNILAVLIQYYERTFLLEGIYGPNIDSPEFYSDLAFKKLIEWDPEFSIFVGDYNVVLDPQVDTKNYLHINNPNAMRELNQQIGSLNLVDIWRELHPGERTYT